MSTSTPVIDGVLFDLDGTLIETKSLYIEAFRRAVEPYVRKDLGPEEIKALKPTSEVAFVRTIVEARDFEEALEAFYGAYEALHDEQFQGVYPGVHEVLERLRSAGIRLGLVTGKSRRSWEITRAAIAGLGPFDALVFDDDVRAPKPDPHGLEIAAEAMDVRPGNAAYVGDTLTDMKAARSAGMRPVAALWSFDDARRARHLERIRPVEALALDRPESLLDALGIDA